MSSGHEHIKNVDYIFSSYTTWKIKLTNLSNPKNFNFHNFKEYKYKIDLELAGKVSFITDSKFFAKSNETIVNFSYTTDLQRKKKIFVQKKSINFMKNLAED